jgi:hypothetical protein
MLAHSIEDLAIEEFAIKDLADKKYCRAPHLGRRTALQVGSRCVYLRPRKDKIARTTTMAPIIQMMLFMITLS